MRKQIAVFMALLLIPASQSIQIEKLDNYKYNGDIQRYEISSNNDFSLEVNTKNQIYVFSKEGLERNFAPEGVYAANSIDIKNINGSDLFLTGSKFGSSYWLLINSKGKKITKKKIRTSLDNGAFVSNNSVIVGNSYFYSLHKFSGEKRWERNQKRGIPLFPDAGDVDNDGKKEILVGNSGKGILQLIDIDGKKEWEKNLQGRSIGYTSENSVISWWEKGLSRLSGDSGDEIWKVKIGNKHTYPLILEDKLIYSTEHHLIARNISDGDLLEKREIDNFANSLTYLPKRDRIAALQGKNLSFYNSELRQVRSIELSEKPVRGLQKTGADSDSKYELAYATTDEIVIQDIQSSERKISGFSLEDSVVVGSGREVLKGVALNGSVVAADSYGEVSSELRNQNRSVVGAGDIEGVESVDNLNEAFNYSGEKWYVEDREKAVYLAALAARENVSVTFRKDRAERDFSDTSMEKVRRSFIEEFRPHHVAVADLDSTKGLLASYMAVKQGVYPVDIDEEMGSEQVEQEIEAAFRRIGENRNTVLEGRYVSMLEGPRKQFEDPVDKGIIGDSKDGSSFRSDLEYGNLDSDRNLEAGVGRFPGKPGEASLMYLRSLEGSENRKAVLAGEYLHSRWPVILATFGGGMWDVKNLGYSLEQEGYEVERLVEHRSKPAALIFDLLGVPTKMDAFVNGMDSSQEKLGALIGSTGASAAKNAAYMIRGLSYAERTLQVYLEFDWINYSFEPGELELPSSASMKEVNETVMSAFPERYGSLKKDGLRKSIRDAGIIYYQGIGDGSRWVLPDRNRSGFVDGKYSGDKSFGPGDLPELENPVVWDNSNTAIGGDMHREFLEKGASAYLGFSSVNYEAYSALLSDSFFGNGKSLGRSQVNSVNNLRNSFMVYNPSSGFRTGVRDKMEKSLNLYGNPEMKKTPRPEKNNRKQNKNCERGVCEVKVEVNGTGGPNSSIEEADSYIMKPGAPVTPVRHLSFEIPEEAEVEEVGTDQEYRKIDIAPQEKMLLDHSGESRNISLNYTKFPSKKKRVESSGDRIDYVQAGIQYRKDGEDRLLEEAEINIEYRSPVTLELEKDSGIKARVYSKKKRTAKIAYRINGEEDTKTVELEEGVNEVKLREKEPGIYSVEAFLYDEELLDSDRSELEILKQPELHVFTPDIRKGTTRKVTAVVENRENQTLHQNLELEISGDAEFGLLEKEEKKVKLPPRENVEVEWRAIGLEEGSYTAEVRNSSSSSEVKESSWMKRVMDSGKILSLVKGKDTGIEKKFRHDEKKMRLETPSAMLEIRKNYSHEKRKLKAPGFLAEETESSDKNIRKVVTGDGTYREVKTPEGSRRVSGISKGLAEKRLEQLERETEKFRDLLDN